MRPLEQQLGGREGRPSTPASKHVVSRTQHRTRLRWPRRPDYAGDAGGDLREQAVGTGPGTGSSPVAAYE